jgi:putative DNA primase/helicase
MAKVVDSNIEPDFNRSQGTKTKEGKPFPTIDNLRRLLALYQIKYGYNVIAKEIVIEIPNQEFTHDNKYEASLAWITSRMEEREMSTRHVDSHLIALCDTNPINPVKDYITKKKWDGESRKDAFYNTITVAPKNTAAKECFLFRFLIGACRAATSDNGSDSTVCPVLQGAQGLGKGRWIKKLVPFNLGLLKAEARIDPGHKDSVEQTISYWIVELAELETTLGKVEIGKVKAFLMSPFDVLRKSYGRRPGRYPRRTVFVASVNHKLFLKDTTGNRRFPTIPCIKINYEHDIDMQQLWAEIYEDVRAGEQHWLTDKEYEMLKEINADHESMEPVQEAILVKYDWDSNPDLWRWKTATQVLEEINWRVLGKREKDDAAEIIRELNGNRTDKIKIGRVLLVPPLFGTKCE